MAPSRGGQESSVLRTGCPRDRFRSETRASGGMRHPGPGKRPPGVARSGGSRLSGRHPGKRMRGGGAGNVMAGTGDAGGLRRATVLPGRLGPPSKPVRGPSAKDFFAHRPVWGAVAPYRLSRAAVAGSVVAQEADPGDRLGRLVAAPQAAVTIRRVLGGRRERANATGDDHGPRVLQGFAARRPPSLDCLTTMGMALDVSTLRPHRLSARAWTAAGRTATLKAPNRQVCNRESGAKPERHPPL